MGIVKKRACYDPNFYLLFNLKVPTGQFDAYCLPTFDEITQRVPARLYQRNSAPPIDSSLSTDFTAVWFAGHLLEDVDTRLFNKSIKYEQLILCGEPIVGDATIIALPTVSIRRARTFGIPVTMLVRTQFGGAR
jgi:hypothetical protein